MKMYENIWFMIISISVILHNVMILPVVAEGARLSLAIFTWMIGVGVIIKCYDLFFSKEISEKRTYKKK